ncbi:MAG TPA: hypothetical protein K8V54_05710, partial [Corynebacterium kroppenstedtii]|nr:hypothetical protein [Corynebacterium kroppenstedtii]
IMGITSGVVRIMRGGGILCAVGSISLVMRRSRVIRRHPIVHPTITKSIHYIRRHPANDTRRSTALSMADRAHVFPI